MVAYWGVQSRFYSSSANAALFYEGEGRTAMGGSATAVGPTGASGAGSNVMRNTALLASYQAILSTQATGAAPPSTHRIVSRVRAVQVPTTNTGEVTVALEWAEGDFTDHAERRDDYPRRARGQVAARRPRARLAARGDAGDAEVGRSHPREVDRRAAMTSTSTT